MIWSDAVQKVEALPAAWVIATEHAPRTQHERSLLRHDTTRAVLATQLGVPAEGIALANDARGRLLARGPEDEVLHVSHGTRDGVVIVAMGRGRIGADIERLGAGPIPFGVLAPTEQQWLQKMPEEERDLAFASLWAVKEAHGKWAGTGLIAADAHPALPEPDGSWRVTGSLDLLIVVRTVTIGVTRYALAVAGG